MNKKMKRTADDMKLAEQDEDGSTIQASSLSMPHKITKQNVDKLFDPMQTSSFKQQISLARIIDTNNDVVINRFVLRVFFVFYYY